MKFTIITPCYNTQKTIAQTIESIIYQHGSFYIQYIVVDGNSQDDTVKILYKYKNALVNNQIMINCLGIDFIIISEQDKGMYDALAKGLRIANGDITSYINADDYYLPNALLSLQYIFEGFPNVKWLTCTNTWYNSIGSITYSFKPFRYKRKLIQKGFYNGKILPHIQQESTFWRSELNNKIDLNKLVVYKLAGDFYLWHVFSTYHELYTLYNQLSGFRISMNQKSNDMALYYQECSEIIKDKSPSLIDYFFAQVERVIWYSPDKIRKFFKFPTKLVLNNSVIENIEKQKKINIG
ncbi:MAG: glycosyltransferase [Bacteroidales bacterium]|nr:glycosyltransferase [Bacteroidales bacterium]